MSLKEIKEMINLMNDNGLSELELEREGLKVRLRKDAPPVITQAAAPAYLPAEPVPTPAAEVPQKNDNVIEIACPMVGTFYQSPAPDAPAYVKKGDSIEVGQVLCIVEAMKLMNEIKSEVAGKLVEIRVKNAEPVQFGQVMFAVEKE